ncbi:SLC13 family permease [Aliikangiella maris]|uniref:SLC13 family permease n=2 Tax=Aliikangiella maris TaxID=3162458 RepID=A0ABV2BY70_9GAMM
MFPAIPNYHALAMLFLTIAALYLFRREDIKLESSCLAVLILVTVIFEIFPYIQPDGRHLESIHFFYGFGHEALVAVCALMIAGQGLVRTGALEPVGRMLGRLWKSNPQLSLLVTLLVAAVLSAFMNNTPIVVLLIPILISVSMRNNTSPSGMLMPMGFATLVGGMSTTIGTSTNLLVVAVAAEQGMRKLGVFDFAIPATVAGVVAIIYLWLIAPKLLPPRDSILESSAPRLFTAHLTLNEKGFGVGKTLAELIDATNGSLKAERIQRFGSSSDIRIMPMPDVVMQAGDRIRVSDTAENLKDYEKIIGAQLFVGKHQVDETHPLIAEDQQLAEVIIVPGSPLAGSTLKNIRFIDQYQMVAIALHREGKEIDLYKKLGSVSLHVGDILLVQGSRDKIAEIKKKGDLLVLDATTDLPHTNKAPLALFIMGLVIGLAAFGILPIAISALLGVMALLTTRCINWSDASRALNTQVILIVVASLALGEALMKTGGADYLAQLFLFFTQGLPPPIILSALMLLLAVLTNIVSNNAAAVIGTPIAISVASQLGLPAEPFVIAVLFGANFSYATPMAYKTNLLIMNAGGYQFKDFMRIGIPLALTLWLTLSIFIPFYYDIF